RLLSITVGMFSTLVIEVFLVTVISGPSTSRMMCCNLGRVSSVDFSRTSTLGRVSPVAPSGGVSAAKQGRQVVQAAAIANAIGKLREILIGTPGKARPPPMGSEVTYARLGDPDMGRSA